MALLNTTGSAAGAVRGGRRGARSGLVLLAYALFAAGCTLMGMLGGSGAPEFGFNHAVHTNEGLECGDCHMAWETEDAPGMPIRGGCDLCHEALDAEKPPERRIDQLFDGDTYRAKQVSKLSDEVIFSHVAHATKPIECGACHTGIAQNTLVDASVAVDMKACQTCHQEQQVANDCATCHQRLRTDVAPDSHGVQWQTAHGLVARAHEAGVANDCALCHRESDCKSCHLANPPQNHDNFFRLRGHGLHARMDRQDCTVCHRSDSCDACHQVTRPLNHSGSFAGSLQTHCVGCHLPVQNSDCATCHRGTPSHDLAAPKPPDHSPGMNCRLCHGAGQPLPHVDKGDDCNICHR